MLIAVQLVAHTALNDLHRTTAVTNADATSHAAAIHVRKERNVKQNWFAMSLILISLPLVSNPRADKLIKKADALRFSVEVRVAKKNAVLTRIAREITNVASTVAVALVSRLLHCMKSQQRLPPPLLEALHLESSTGSPASRLKRAA